MTKTQEDRKHVMTAILRREIALAEATKRLNEHRDSVGWTQERTPAQKEMLAGIPPITAFMGMEG